MIRQLSLRSLLLSACLVLALVIAAAMVQSDANAQKKGKTRPLTSSQMMAGLVKPQFVALKAGLEKESRTDDEWKALATNAALLNESGYFMMDDGRCPDEVWEEGAKMMRTATVDVLKHIEKRNAKAALESFAGVAASCKHCHAEHKYKKKK